MGNRPDADHVAEFCRPGYGKNTCRYIASDSDGWICVKHMPSVASVINMRIITDSMRAQGDNCPGLKE